MQQLEARIKEAAAATDKVQKEYNGLSEKVVKLQHDLEEQVHQNSQLMADNSARQVRCRGGAGCTAWWDGTPGPPLFAAPWSRVWALCTAAGACSAAEGGMQPAHMRFRRVAACSPARHQVEIRAREEELAAIRAEVARVNKVWPRRASRHCLHACSGAARLARQPTAVCSGGLSACLLASPTTCLAGAPSAAMPQVRDAALKKAKSTDEARAAAEAERDLLQGQIAALERDVVAAKQVRGQRGLWHVDMRAAEQREQSLSGMRLPSSPEVTCAQTSEPAPSHCLALLPSVAAA